MSGDAGAPAVPIEWMKKSAMPLRHRAFIESDFDQNL
jgi:hypothetical protein